MTRLDLVSRGSLTLPLSQGSQSTGSLVVVLKGQTAASLVDRIVQGWSGTAKILGNIPVFGIRRTDPVAVEPNHCRAAFNTTGVRLLGLIRPTGAVERGLPTSNTKEQHSRPEALLLTSNTNSSARAYCFLPPCLGQGLSYLNLLDERGTTEGCFWC